MFFLRLRLTSLWCSHVAKMKTNNNLRSRQKVSVALCVRIAGCNVVDFRALGFQSKTWYDETLARQLTVQKFMATVFCNSWVQILLCAKLIFYVHREYTSNTRQHDDSEPTLFRSQFSFFFPNLLRKEEIVSFKPCSRNWFRNLPSENKRELEMLTVILGRLLEVPDIRGTYRK
jgi:hypothetical protein